MKVVILAGGRGTRISEESCLRPKPMIEIGEAPILWHIMKYYSSFGYNDFIICCGYKGHIIKEYFANYFLNRSDVVFDYRNGNQIKIVKNDAEPWRVTLADTGGQTQTGGRIRRARKYIGDETFMLTYGDGLANVNLHTLLNRHKKSGYVATMTAVQPGGRYGVLRLDKNAVIGFREKAREDSLWINAGFMVLNPEIFGYIQGDETIFEKEPLEMICAESRLGVYKHYGFWRCMDTMRDKECLEQLWESGEAAWKVW